jgi:hypothetical protein
MQRVVSMMHKSANQQKRSWRTSNCVGFRMIEDGIHPGMAGAMMTDPDPERRRRAAMILHQKVPRS